MSLPCWCRVARGAHFVGQRGREFVDEHVLDGDGVGQVVHAEAHELGDGDVGVALGFSRGHVDAEDGHGIELLLLVALLGVALYDVELLDLGEERASAV